MNIRHMMTALQVELDYQQSLAASDVRLVQALRDVVSAMGRLEGIAQRREAQEFSTLVIPRCECGSALHETDGTCLSAACLLSDASTLSDVDAHIDELVADGWLMPEELTQ